MQRPGLLDTALLQQGVLFSGGLGQLLRESLQTLLRGPQPASRLGSSRVEGCRGSRLKQFCSYSSLPPAPSNMSLVEGCWALTGLRVLVEGWIFGRTKASSHLLAQTFWAWGPDFEPCEITWPESLVYIVLMYKIVQILFVLVPLNLRETKIAHSPCPPPAGHRLARACQSRHSCAACDWASRCAWAVCACRSAESSSWKGAGREDLGQLGGKVCKAYIREDLM